MRIIRAAKVLTGHPGEVIADGEVLIDGSTIVSVGPRGSGGDSAEVVDLPGHTVLPGLIDAHVHLRCSRRSATAMRRSSSWPPCAPPTPAGWAR